MIDQRRAWSVRFVLPKDESKGRSWNRNETAMVLATTVQRAIEALMRKHPDGHIDAVNHKGGDELIIDEAP